MTELILRILLKGGEIFHDERKRQIYDTLVELSGNVQKEKNKRFPNFNSDRLALAEQKLETFLVGYEKEFGQRLDEILQKAFSNE